MSISDILWAATLDARPSSLPDRAPRCLEDELLPDATPLPPPAILGKWQRDTPQGREQRRQRDRKRKREQRAAQTERAVEVSGPLAWCERCTVRLAMAGGRCSRRACR